MDLASLLRAEDVDVIEERDWRTYGRPGEWHPAGVMWHHTAGQKDLAVVRDGRRDLAGPLANVWLSKQGVAHVISAGRCNHAGAGAGIVLAGVRRDFPPAGDARDRHLVDDTSGNAWFYGVEMENLGTGLDPWPPGQIDAAVRIGAALCRTHGWTGARNVGHREWTARKPDPAGISLPYFRSLVAARLNLTAPLEEDIVALRTYQEDGIGAEVVFIPGRGAHQLSADEKVTLVALGLIRNEAPVKVNRNDARRWFGDPVASQ